MYLLRLLHLTIFVHVLNQIFEFHRNKKRAEDELAPLTEQTSHINRLKQTHVNKVKTESDKVQTLSVELNKLDEKSCKFQEAIVKAEGDLKVIAERKCFFFLLLAVPFST